MKLFWKTLKAYTLWLLFLLAIDSFFTLLLWLSDVQAFAALVGVIVLTSLILFSAIILSLYFREQNKQKLFQSFLAVPDTVNIKKLLGTVSGQERDQLEVLIAALEKKQNRIQEMETSLHDYEEYVEEWAHEAKTPLSLLTMILDNHADEFASGLKVKLDYVRNQIQEDITQILYYARLGSSTKDYKFETVWLKEVLEEVLEDYAPLLEEKQFVVENHLREERTYTDRRGLLFMLGQIISNSIKYSGEAPKLTVSLESTARSDVLTVSDNGSGIKSYDLPYIFQKGFTGDSADSQKKATGMGLYLTKKMADDLNIKLEAQSKWGEGAGGFHCFSENQIGLIKNCFSSS